MLSREMWYAAESIGEYVPNTLPDLFPLLALLFSFFCTKNEKINQYCERTHFAACRSPLPILFLLRTM